jgi:hypothetical protein
MEICPVSPSGRRRCANAGKKAPDRSPHILLALVGEVGDSKAPWKRASRATPSASPNLPPNITLMVPNVNYQLSHILEIRESDCMTGIAPLTTSHSPPYN